jgi:hypothetical protein
MSGGKFTMLEKALECVIISALVLLIVMELAVR